jgi:hypothetical protein
MRVLGFGYCLVTSLAASAAMGATLTGYGTASIDGVLSAGEWDTAGFVVFAANIPGGRTAPATLWAMNDDTNLYLALAVMGTYGDPPYFSVSFDNDGSNTVSFGDDLAEYSQGFALSGYGDLVWTEFSIDPGVPIRTSDTGRGGTTDGTGDWSNSGDTIFEIAKPLFSGDPHDFALGAGDTIGLRTVFSIGSGGVVVASTIRPMSLDEIGIVSAGTSPIPIPGALGMLGSALGLGLLAARQQNRRRKLRRFCEGTS